MKKILICLLLFTTATGCSYKGNNSVSTPEPTIIASITPTEDSLSQLNHEELIKGNFSSIAGEYISADGKNSITINDEGLREGEVKESDVNYSNGTYQMSIRVGDDATGGIAITIAPIGVEFDGVHTDTTKIRISYGNGDPISDEHIYTKK